ncbi:hypothetical protein Kpol_534p46 [Vanderwaltozyma polyspora DSM 70294]|uniref:Uncharacterized protein n=1 Tax=Vanderwaltozyma polyspora (strain ATCC 22028 / DSM 70294 / BCRC 21397 / CBS 2163 / NBRC 10782 / NRRL Y-8283 / UCD 57-17) TaxID=436907 RepID=A7TJM2_VANPO|nr:uncharacterized protein Kpol_534p46 [Vanderwaltozyma polyspora DSM 70294]EDO17565.1 hypothetical protein Kpol_534p46 [Vanderwaltozyma polyspora DSM 70294]
MDEEFRGKYIFRPYHGVATHEPLTRTEKLNHFLEMVLPSSITPSNKERYDILFKLLEYEGNIWKAEETKLQETILYLRDVLNKTNKEAVEKILRQILPFRPLVTPQPPNSSYTRVQDPKRTINTLLNICLDEAKNDLESQIMDKFDILFPLTPYSTDSDDKMIQRYRNPESDVNTSDKLGSIDDEHTASSETPSRNLKSTRRKRTSKTGDTEATDRRTSVTVRSKRQRWLNKIKNQK